MKLTQEEQEYITKHKLKCVQGHGCSDSLYQSRWGVRTISDIMEMDVVQRRYDLRPTPVSVRPILVSAELEARNERCIDQYGCGMY